MSTVRRAEHTRRPHHSTDQPALRHAFQKEDRGQPLDPAIRHHLEPRFGHSFAGVRVHADHHADRLARELGARAFTAGHEIFFREGRYDSSSRDGLRLIAHELAHTIQQTEAPGTAAGPAIGHPSDRFEEAASAAADAVTAVPGTWVGEASMPDVHAASGTLAGAPALQCAKDDAASGLGLLGTLMSGVASVGRLAIGQVGTAGDATAAAQAAQGTGVFNVAGGGINLAKGISGLVRAEDAGDVISPLIGSIGGGMQLLGGGVAAATGASGGLAALGPLGAAVALGGTLGGIAGEQLWEWDKQAHMGSRTEDATGYGSDFVPGVPYDQERSWLFNLLEGD